MVDPRRRCQLHERTPQTWAAATARFGQHTSVTDEGAYGRVTDPGRYAPLHQAAFDLVRTLLTQYHSEVVRNGEPYEPPAELVVGSPLQICPANEGAGCLTVEATDFPGVRVGAGNWHSFHFPRCGCDACDEDPSQVIAEMREIVDAFVGGRFVESVGNGRLGLKWSSPNSSSEGWGELPDDHRLRHHKSQTVAWAAWQRRSE